MSRAASTPSPASFLSRGGGPDDLARFRRPRPRHSIGSRSIAVPPAGSDTRGRTFLSGARPPLAGANCSRGGFGSRSHEKGEQYRGASTEPWYRSDFSCTRPVGGLGFLDFRALGPLARDGAPQNPSNTTLDGFIRGIARILGNFAPDFPRISSDTTGGLSDCGIARDLGSGYGPSPVLRGRQGPKGEGPCVAVSISRAIPRSGRFVRGIARVFETLAAQSLKFASNTMGMFGFRGIARVFETGRRSWPSSSRKRRLGSATFGPIEPRAPCALTLRNGLAPLPRAPAAL